MNNIRMKCVKCDAIFYYSEQEILEDFPSHCGKLRLLIDFSDFDIAHNRWIAFDAGLKIQPPNEN